MGRLPGLFLRFGVAAGCLLYVFWGIDWEEFGRTMLRFGLLPIALATVYSFLQYLPSAWRLSYLTGGRASLRDAFKATIFCLGVNNVLPAKLGELAKAFYLRRTTGISLGEGLGLVFWERFFDLNTLLVMGLVSALLLGKNLAVAPLAVVVGGIWLCIALILTFPSLPQFASRFVPGERLKLLFLETIRELRGRMRPVQLLQLAAYSAVVWAGFSSVFFLVILWVARLDLSVAQVLTVFVISALGFAVPSTPGGLGVFEAAIVLALGWFGVDKETGLAVGLVLRLLNYVPQTLGGMYVMVQSGFSLKSLRQREPEDI